MSIEVRVYKGEVEIKKIKNVFEMLQYHPNSDYEHFLMVCRLRPNVKAPFVLGLWENGSCRGLFVGRIEQEFICPSIGYMRLPGSAVKMLTFIYKGVLGEFDFVMADALFEALDNMLARKEVDAVSFHSVPENLTPFWKILKQRGRLSVRLSKPSWSIHRELTLEKEPGFLVRNMRSKHRSWIKRKERELESAFHKKVCWVWHSKSLDVPELCSRIETVARTTYQRGIGAGFFDNDETRQRLSLFAKRGQLRVLILEILGIPKAFWLGTIYGNTFHSEATGYTPDVMEFEAGTQTFLRLVDEIVKEGVVMLDFGLGDAHYKERFADRSWREGTGMFFGPTFRGWLIWMYLQIISRLDGFVRLIVQHFGVFDRVKKAWRGRLRS